MMSLLDMFRRQPLGNLETQRMGGMGASPFAQFAQSPEGQQALLQFSAMAMQGAQNPNVGFGQGLLGAVGQGMGGYQQTQQRAGEKAWTEEERGMRRKEHGIRVAESGKPGKPGKPTTLPGADFYWIWDSEANKFVKTDVPTRKAERKPTYKIFNNKLYSIADGKMTVLAEGTSFNLALSYAQKDPTWQYGTLAEKAQILADYIEIRRMTKEGELPSPTKPAKKMDETTRQQIWEESGHNPDRATQIAIDRGYEVEE